MTPITLNLELHHNNRTIQGLMAREEHLADDYDWAVRPGHFPGKDIIDVALADMDLGRFDAEGDRYIVEFLNILPGDLIGWYVEEEAAYA